MQVRDDGDLASTMAAYFHYYAAAVDVDRVKWTTSAAPEKARRAGL